MKQEKLTGEEKRWQEQLHSLGCISQVKMPPVKWFVEFILAEGHNTLIHAEASRGKSTLILSMMHHILASEPILGLKTTNVDKDARILYFNQEAANDFIKDVQAHALQHLPLSMKDVWKKLVITERNGTQYKLPRDEKIIAKLIENIKADIVIYDSLRKFSEVDENASELGKVLSSFHAIRSMSKRPKLAILIIHHNNKTGRTYSGHSIISTEPDIRLQIIGSRGQRQKLTFEKIRTTEGMQNFDVNRHGIHYLEYIAEDFRFDRVINEANIKGSNEIWKIFDQLKKGNKRYKTELEVRSAIGALCKPELTEGGVRYRIKKEELIGKDMDMDSLIVK